MTVIFAHRPPRRPKLDALYLCAKDRQVMRRGMLRHLSPQAFTVLVLLAINGEHLTTLRDVEELLWGEDEDGGPEDTVGILKQHVLAIRRATARLGVRLENCFGQGFRFRLEG